MINIIRFVVVAAVFFNSLWALPFGQVGVVSPSIGSAGVALRSSPWGLHYNPALIGVNEHFKIGYSFCGGVRVGSDLMDLIDKLKADSAKKGTLFVDMNEIFGGAGGDVNASAGTNVCVGLAFQTGSGGIGGFAFGALFNMDSSFGASASSSSSSNSVSAGYSARGDLIALGELPFGYGYQFYTPVGGVSLGMVVKYMYLAKFGANQGMRYSGNFVSSSSSSSSSLISASSSSTSYSYSHSSSSGHDFSGGGNFGVDMGVLYTTPMYEMSIGLVAKNINSPEFETIDAHNDFQAGKNYKIPPQLRLGLGYNINKFIFALDFDLTKNKTISDGYSQIVGGGMLFDINWATLRGGLMYDFRNSDGIILTGGMSLFGFIDFAVQTGTRFSSVRTESGSVLIPSYFYASFGGTISF